MWSHWNWISKLALCGMKCIKLRLNTVKILGIHFSYNKKIENNEKCLKQINSIEKVLKLWRMQNLTFRRIKITVFKALAMSKIVHLALITNNPTSTMKELSKIQKWFIWKYKNLKMKHTTSYNNYDSGRLKIVDISSIIINLHCSSIKKLYGNTTLSWKVMSLHLIKTTLGLNFKYNSR